MEEPTQPVSNFAVDASAANPEALTQFTWSELYTDVGFKSKLLASIYISI